MWNGIDLEALPNEGSKVMNQFKSKLIKLPDSIVNSKNKKLQEIILGRCTKGILIGNL